MIDWYYRLGKKQGGPVSTETLLELTKAGTIKPDTMLWHFGLGDWQKASETAELTEALATAPSVAPVEVRDPTLAGPWARLWARMIDVYIVTYGLVFGFTYLVSLYAPAFYLRTMAALDGLISKVVVLPFAMFVFAAMMSVTGTTIGKAIIGIKVENISGRGSVAFHFLRELKVWIFGLGFGIPLVNLLTGTTQAAKLSKSGSTGYDRGFAVVRRKSSDLQYSVGVFFAIAVVSIGTYWNIAYKAEEARAQEVRTWVNPATGKQARFANMWATEEWKADAGKLYYFQSSKLLVEALLGYEPLEENGVDPVVYGEALQEALATDIAVDSEWKPVMVDGFPAATAKATQTNVADTHLEITVVIIGRSAWRVLLFVRGRSTEEFTGKDVLVHSLFSTAKDINAPVNMPCEDETCLSQLSAEKLHEPS
ncbi:RDD family protein [Rhizobium sp. XQZ8]|uniref:RDD family protein n=1 Tax=Rhizobium populisoli TaxID=2859785 RepID=UPI001C682CF9|nr:RDD family protein [Rhizobium populisoli]MBW6423349.1 RDD family protein [Rhizobium populisoli]